MEPLRHLRPLPSTTAGLRSTFDRLPYGCLLFMYRLPTTSLRNQGLKFANSVRRKIIRRALTSPAHHLLFLYVIIILWLILRVDVQQHRPTHHRFFSFV